jgi:ribonucleoside-diphosphate reductase alpha chain
LLTSIRKKVYKQFEPTSLVGLITKNVEEKLYQDDLLTLYSMDEWLEIESFIDHTRDFNFTYAGLKQVYDKYLVRHRVHQTYHETPQVAYILIAAVLFSQYPKETRLDYVRRYYDAISLHKISLATPILAGVRTPTKQYSSCVLIRVDDSLDSIFASNTVLGKYVAQRAGIGLDFSAIRALGSTVRNGEVKHTGAVGFVKMFESTIGSCSQGGLRKGSATLFYPFWHSDVDQYLVLKNNKGNDENRARKLDYGIALSRLFYDRALKKQDISLFNPNDVQDLLAAFGLPEFEDLYLKYEQSSVPRTTINAYDLLLQIVTERSETGRLYIFNIDHANYHSSFIRKIWQSNLCLEITLPTETFQSLDDPNGEIATCILSAFNLGYPNIEKEMPELADLIVRSLDSIVDLQEYPFTMAAKSSLLRRNIGVGYINFAYWLAKNGLKWDSNHTREKVHQIAESTQYWLLIASNNLARERGACDLFAETKYAHGLLPIDTYKKDVDSFASFDLQHDWEELRHRIAVDGLRNSTLTAIMPSESSAICANATNGIEPPRQALTNKGSKSSVIKILTPEYNTLEYQYLWSIPNNEGYLKVVAIMQKFFDQAISTNLNYNPLFYDNQQIPLEIVLRDILNAYKWGIKTLYYHNTYDMNSDQTESGCDSGACAI